MGYKDDFDRKRAAIFGWQDPAQRLIDQMRQIERLANPYPVIEDPLSHLRDALNPALLERQRLIDSIVTPPRIAGILDDFRSLREAALQFDKTNDLLGSLREMAFPRQDKFLAVLGHSSVESLRQSIDGIWERALPSVEILAASGLRDVARDAAAVSYASLKAITAQLDHSGLLSQVGPRAVSNLYAPINYHAHFTAEALVRLKDVPASSHEAHAIRGALVLFNEQMTNVTAGISPLIVPGINRRQRGKGTPGRQRPFNLPVIEEAELLEQSDLPAEADYATLARLAPATELAQDALACVFLYARCNDARRLQEKEPIFKPTTRSVVVACNLTLIVAVDRDSFDYFVDLLYILIYEGSGAGKTRVLAENNGVMQRDESDALWDIKHLRSKRSRHDIEHGSEGEIRKKYRELRQVLARLGLSRFPQTAGEYRQLQHAVLRNLKEYLTKVAERIESESQ